MIGRSMWQPGLLALRLVPLLLICGCSSGTQQASTAPVTTGPTALGGRADPTPAEEEPKKDREARLSPFDSPPSHPECIPAYRALPARLGLNPDAVARSALIEQALQPRAKVGSRHLSGAALRERVLEATGVGLLRGEATWTAGHPVARGRLQLRELVAMDPLLGEWPAAKLSPSGSGPYPAVLLLHGHGDTVKDALTVRFGQEIASAGFVVLAPSIRSYWDGHCESEAAWTLLQAGMTLMAVHLAEASRAVEHLRRDPAVDPARVYVVGHSGGGGIAELLPFITDVQGVITDGPLDFGYFSPDGLVGDDFIPGLRDVISPRELRKDGALGAPAAFQPIGPKGRADDIISALRRWSAPPPG